MTDHDPLAAVEAAALAILAADPNALSNTRSFAARLGDRAPAAKRESRILAQAVADGAGLLRAAAGDRRIARAQLASRLEGEHGYRSDLAQWAVGVADRLVHGADTPQPAAGADTVQPAAGADTPQPAAGVRPAGPVPTDGFTQAAPVAGAGAGSPTGATAAAGRPGLADWLWSLAVVLAVAFAFAVSIDGVGVFSVVSTYAFDTYAQGEQAVWMLGYAAIIGAPFGALAATRRQVLVLAGFALAFVVLALVAGVPAAIGRLVILVPCAVLAMAAAAAARRLPHPPAALAAIIVGAMLAIGLHMAVASMLAIGQAGGAEVRPNLLKIGSGLASVAVTAAVGAFFGGLWMRSAGTARH